VTSGLRVAVLFNLQENAPPPAEDAPTDVLIELDTEKNVKAYLNALAAAGHEVSAFEGDLDLPAKLRAWQPHICFNMCEGYRGDSREAQVPALLEIMGLRYTGAKVLSLALTLDKAMTKRVLAFHGLPTPEFQVFYSPDDPLDPALARVFPLFTKPVREGTSIGIGRDALVHNEAALRERVARLLAAYREPVLVERYIDGPDISVGLIGNVPDATSGLPQRTLGGNGTFLHAMREQGIHFLPMNQVVYDAYPPGTERFYSVNLKRDLADDYHCLCPAPLSPAQTDHLRSLAALTFWACGALDFSRVDFRLDAQDDYKPYILEINALPGVTPISDMTVMAAAEGWSHADLVVAVLNAGLRRNGLPVDPATDPMAKLSTLQGRRILSVRLDGTMLTADTTQ
jgi:D-alanine-D-alanine ligase